MPHASGETARYGSSPRRVRWRSGQSRAPIPAFNIDNVILAPLAGMAGQAGPSP